jgi:hypothetical protein
MAAASAQPFDLSQGGDSTSVTRIGRNFTIWAIFIVLGEFFLF